MERCLNCELLVENCICSRVDDFFAQGRDAESRLDPDLIDLPDPFETWFIAGRVACFCVAFMLASLGCSASHRAVSGGNFDDKKPAASPTPTEEVPATDVATKVTCTMSLTTYGIQINCQAAE
jgi:hypothetical protein